MVSSAISSADSPVLYDTAYSSMCVSSLSYEPAAMTDEIISSEPGMAIRLLFSVLRTPGAAVSYTTSIICMLSLSTCDSKCSPIMMSPSMDSLVELPMLEVL